MSSSSIKSTYKNPRANIILNGEKLNVSPLISGTGMSALITLIQHDAEVLDNAIKQEKDIHGF